VKNNLENDSVAQMAAEANEKSKGKLLGRGANNSVFALADCCVLRKPSQALNKHDMEILTREKEMLDAVGKQSAAKIVWLTTEGMIMEKINGMDLSEVFELHIGYGMGQDEKEVCEAIGVAVVTSLKTLRKSKVYHGDLHTGNIMISNMADSDYKAIFIDFEYGKFEHELDTNPEKARKLFSYLHICDILSIIVTSIVNGYTPTALVRYLKDNVDECSQQSSAVDVQREIIETSKKFRIANAIGEVIKTIALQTLCDPKLVKKMAEIPQYERFLFYSAKIKIEFKAAMENHFTKDALDALLYHG
jgi:hypothetical protein